ncbi:Quercetin 2,3-dioxygenase [compost metagenome]
MHADARLWAGLFDGDERHHAALPAGRKCYVHLVRGSLQINGTKLTSGDAALLENEAHLTLDAGVDAEVLVFDLAA